MKTLNNTIQEAYCSFEVSKLLKEKGFKVPSKLHYPESREQDTYCKVTDWNTFTDMSGNSNYFTKPTHALAIEWIRFNFGIWIQCSILSENNWHYSIRQKINNWNIEFPKKEKFNSPQEATEAALLYTLKELI